MIFYFSGTGNSLWVAKELANFYNEKLISVSEELLRSDNDFSYSICPDEKIFFVFPVHSWGTDVLTFRFLKKINLVGYQNQSVFMVCTCGDNCGYAAKIVKGILRKKSVALTRYYSVQMPNNYVLMRGFNVDDKETEIRKLTEAHNKIRLIIDDISTGTGKGLYVQGKFAFLKTRIIYPLFRKYGIKKNLFYAKDTCISCRLCIDICPTKSIFMRGRTLKWNKNTCVQCTACINRCPVRAIEYGKISETKGHYCHPDM